MKKTILSLLFGGVASAMFAQVNFQTQTSNTTHNLEGVYFENFNQIGVLGWAVGANGTILQTPDDGANWNAQNSGVTATLHDIDVVLDQINTELWAWACGSAGTVVSTQNGGVNWGIQSQGAPYTMFAIDFQDLSNGIMAGQNVYAFTTTAGNIWTPSSPGMPTYEGIDFVSASLGWMCGDAGLILQTTDGGANWTTQNSGISSGIMGIDFINANEGWACGYLGTILHTSNGGNTWTAQTSNTGNLLYDIHFFDAQNGWACGHLGTILTTSDGGANWTAYFSGDTGTTAALKNLSLISGTEGWAVGEVGTIIHFSGSTSNVNVDELNTLKLNVSPNPTTSMLKINSEAEVQRIHIYSLTGALVQFETSVSFSVDQLVPGSYLIQVQTTEGTGIVRFVKE